MSDQVNIQSIDDGELEAIIFSEIKDENSDTEETVATDNFDDNKDIIQESTSDTDAENSADANNLEDDENVSDSEESTEEESSSAEEEDSDNTESEDENNAEEDYETAYKELMQPFEVNGEKIELKSIDEIKTLIHKGIEAGLSTTNSNRELKIARTLEKAGLLEDPNKLNKMIDAFQGNKDAIKSLVKEHNVELDDIFSGDGEEAEEYVPKDHGVSDSEIELAKVIKEIESTPTYTKTMDLVTKEWDDASKKALASNPNLLKVINIQMGNGDYDKVKSEINRLKILGRIPAGMSNIDVYGHVAQAILAPKKVKKEKVKPKSSFDKRRAASGSQSTSTSNKADESKLKPAYLLTDEEINQRLGLEY